MLVCRSALSRSSILASLLLAGVLSVAAQPGAEAKFGQNRQPKPEVRYTQSDSTYQYISNVFDKLQTFWSTQASDQRTAANSIISFTLDSKGNVVNSQLDTPNNNDGAGSNALSYIKQTASFGQLPDAVNGQNLEFKFKLSPESLQMLSYRFNDNAKTSTNVISSASPTSSVAVSTSASSLFYARVVDTPGGVSSGKVENKPEAKTTDEQVMEEYVAGIRDHISQQWRQPNETVTTGPAMTLIQIDRDGTLLSATLSQSSGNKEVDRAILNTIYQSVPFAPAPKQVQSLPITVQYVFEPVVNTVYEKQNNLP
jgi:TonB family protein